MARWLKCKEEAIPFLYLGLPVGGNMSSSASWQPIIEKFKSCLSVWKARHLSIGGRLCLCKSVLGSLGTYYFSMFKAPKKVISTLEIIRCHFFWGGTEDVKKISWVVWDRVLSDKKSGRLGIGSLRTLNLAMLAKWWWRERTEVHAIWNAVVRYCNLTQFLSGASRDRRTVWSNIKSTEKNLGDIGININSLLIDAPDRNRWS
ncbi:uncharacterized protein LOC112505369 [Cynara cardunculus var. scolymus]|uniref:uncharacterized protein LOC112505369 n=1 Tax=Cynara cardunculus var. scolymus TaxID=59895 RepID=UPI000D623874|nr:uncharacterized protein LOC112505369 [Cynara cardunculus var. scolymus]